MFTHSGQVKPILDLPSSTRTCKELVPNLIAGRGQMADPIRSTRLRRLLPRVGEHAQFGQIECLERSRDSTAIGFSPTAAKFASRIGSTSRNAVASVKKVLLAGAGRSLDEVKQLERAAFAALFGPEQRARMKSFLARTSG